MDDQKAPQLPEHEAFINRELSWLSFARRVLELAEDPATPLLERVKFAGIMGMIYDEFAMKRLGGIYRRIKRGNLKSGPDGLTPPEELKACRRELNRQCEILARLVRDDLRPALAAANIPLLDYGDLNDIQRSQAQKYFRDSVEPILTPLAVDAGHPFPFISTLGLNLAVSLKETEQARRRFVRIKVPPNRPRWLPVGDAGVVPLEQVIGANLDLLFPNSKEIHWHLFRVIRGAKDDPWDRIPVDADHTDLSAGSLIGMVTTELTARRFAGIVRVEFSKGMPDDLRNWLIRHLEVAPDDTFTVDGLLGLNELVDLQRDGYPELRDLPHKPVAHLRLRKLDRADTGAIFGEIKRGDILLHHPYHSYETSVLRFLNSAVHDPKVLAIKLTIYRTSRKSPIIQALVEAARRGKQVAVLVEITARFDEAPNIAWGEELERAGVHVIYGMQRLKTHVKLALVVREEQSAIRRYVHVSTGNYHPGTARLYEDLGILSADPDLGASVAAVFNELTGAIPVREYAPLMVAPHNLREGFTALIERETQHAAAGGPAGIRAKMNQLQDPEIIAALYRASQAGVPITLNVRGLCCLRAGVPGLSDNIRVFSTLGRFLEHGRIYRFDNLGDPEFFIGSADWMRRNLDRRMETIMKVGDNAIKIELEHILQAYERDNCSAWDMQPDGSYRRRQPAAGEECRGAQAFFIDYYRGLLEPRDAPPESAPQPARLPQKTA